MKRRFIHTIVHVLVAGQLLLSAPVVSAMAAPATADTSEMPCAGMMPATPDADPCPCCPEGEMGEAACLSACLASVGAVTSHALPAAQANSESRHLPFNVRITRLSEPPLKPPPIY